LRPPTSHTTVRTVPYTAVPVVPHFGDVVACQPLSAQPSLTDSVRYFRFQALLRGICSGPTEISSRTSPTGSALCRVVTPAPTASADFCRSIPTPYGVGSPRQIDRSPRVRRTTFLPSTRRIYFRTFRVTIGLWISWPPRPSAAAHMRFLFVGPGVYLQLPSDSASRRTPLLFGWRFPSPGSAGDFHPQVPGGPPRPPDSASHGAARHAWRTRKKSGP
jgi:hypothetical protein